MHYTHEIIIVNIILCRAYTVTAFSGLPNSFSLQWAVSLAHKLAEPPVNNEKEDKTPSGIPSDLIRQTTVT